MHGLVAASTKAPFRPLGATHIRPAIMLIS